MAVTNMSIIEKDDLIKKMPRDSLKEELKNPSGNFPLFLVAARLKEVEEMERDVMARQAAQQSSQDAESVAARLAQQAMPQSPMSAVGANPAPPRYYGSTNGWPHSTVAHGNGSDWITGEVSGSSVRDQSRNNCCCGSCSSGQRNSASI